jgi:hypothetical protein
MVEEKKENGFVNIVKDFFGNMSQIFLGTLLPPIVDGTEIIMQNIEKKIKRIEERIIRKISSYLIMMLGSIFLIIALTFYLIEYLKLSKSVAYFSVGIIIFVIGLLLKVKYLAIENNEVN